MSSSIWSLLHLFREQQRKHFPNMLPGYQKFGLLVLTSFLLVIAAEAYSDVDLRIAERRAIPHYIRHSYEYPDIDIKSIMRQRGLLPKQPGFVRPNKVVTQEPWLWRPRYNNRKYLDVSNNLEHPHNSRYEKKYKHYKQYFPEEHEPLQYMAGTREIALVVPYFWGP